MTALATIAAPVLPAIVTAAGERAQIRFLEFFAANIRNANTRRAYARAVVDFLAWCEGRGVASVTDVQPLHVGAYIEALSLARSAPTVPSGQRGDRCECGRRPPSDPMRPWTAPRSSSGTPPPPRRSR